MDIDTNMGLDIIIAWYILMVHFIMGSMGKKDVYSDYKIGLLDTSISFMLQASRFLIFFQQIS